MSGFIQIPGAPASDPHGKRLAAVLKAEQIAEQWLARRKRCSQIVILLSLPMAYLIIRGLGTGYPVARVILTLWTLALVSLFVCIVAAARADKRVYALLGEAGGHRVDLDD